MVPFSLPSVSLTDLPHARALPCISTVYAHSIQRLCTRSALAVIQRTIRGWLFPRQWGTTNQSFAALADAEAAAGLLAAYIAASGSRREWDGWLALGESLRWPAPTSPG